MATLAELKTKVLNIAHNIGFYSFVTSFLNEGVAEIAGGVPSSFGDYITPPLPGLFKIDTVETSLSAAFVSMPDTFQRKLQFVSNSDGREIEVYNSMIEFSGDYPLLNQTGDVQSVIEQGGNLCYQGIPSVAETLTLHFFRLPVEMTRDDDTPDGIPSHLSIPLLVNFVCKKIYQLVQDKDSPAKILYHDALFKDALRTLELTIPTDTRSLFLSE